MALDPPMEVVQFLQFIGVDWTMINEDTVRQVADMVDQFTQRIQAHQDATSTIQTMGQAYQGTSYEQLVQRWADMSQSHMTGSDCNSASHCARSANWSRAGLIGEDTGTSATPVTIFWP